MKFNEAVDIKYNGLSVKQVYYNNNLIWSQAPILPVGELFWDFAAPAGKTLTNFYVVYEGGLIIADWGDGSSQALTSSVNYNKTFS